MLTAVRARDFHAEAEARLGRPLSSGERVIDLAGNDRILEGAKQQLRQAIEAEKRRAIRKHLETGDAPILKITEQMAQVIVGLRDSGRRAAASEVKALTGQDQVIVGGRSYALSPYQSALSQLNNDPSLAAVKEHLGLKLRGLEVKVEKKSNNVLAKISGATNKRGRYDWKRSPIAGQIASMVETQVPGALAAAADLVSGPFASGLADVFNETADLFAAWQYSAIMDGGTCDECGGLDGTVYDSWDAISEVLPDGGPNPDCYGGMRCRCRPVPLSDEDAAAAKASVPIIPGEAEAALGPLTVAEGEVEELTRFDLIDRVRLDAWGEHLDLDAEYAAMRQPLVDEIERLAWTSEAQGEAWAAADRVGADVVKVLRNADGEMQGIVAYNVPASSADYMAIITQVEKEIADGWYPDPLERALQEQVINRAALLAKSAADAEAAGVREVGVNHLASRVKGGGTRLMVEVAKDAEARGMGVGLSSLPEAEGFYARLGFTKGDDGAWHLTPEATAKLARGETPAADVAPAVEPRQLRWQPTMTQADADEWAAGSVVQKTLYHYAYTDDLEDIRREGLWFRGRGAVRLSESPVAPEGRVALPVRLNTKAVHVSEKSVPEAHAEAKAAGTEVVRRQGGYIVWDKKALVIIDDAAPAAREIVPPPPPEPYTHAPLTPGRALSGIEAEEARQAGDDWLNEQLPYHGDRTAAKQQVTEGLYERLRDNDAFIQFAEDNSIGAPSGGYYGDELRNRISGLIDEWAGSSDSGNAWSLAMQRAVHEEFGLDAGTIAHWERRTEDWMITAWRTSGSYYDEHGEALRAFVRAMYDTTQAQLRDAGIDEVILYRGMGYPARSVTRGMTISDVSLQPASSFASDISIACRFAQAGTGESPIIMSARIPASRILGSARTGFGCLSETEYVVLGVGREAKLDDLWVHGGQSSISHSSFWEKARAAQHEGGAGLVNVKVDQLRLGDKLFDPVENAVWTVTEVVPGESVTMVEQVSGTTWKAPWTSPHTLQKMEGAQQAPDFKLVGEAKLEKGDVITINEEWATGKEYEVVAVEDDVQVFVKNIDEAWSQDVAVGWDQSEVAKVGVVKWEPVEAASLQTGDVVTLLDGSNPNHQWEVGSKAGGKMAVENLTTGAFKTIDDSDLVAKKSVEKVKPQQVPVAKMKTVELYADELAIDDQVIFNDVVYTVDKKSGNWTHVVDEHGNEKALFYDEKVKAVALDQDESHFVSKLADVKVGDQVSVVYGNTEYVGTVDKFAPSGQTVAIKLADGTVEIFDTSYEATVFPPATTPTMTLAEIKTGALAQIEEIPNVTWKVVSQPDADNLMVLKAENPNGNTIWKEGSMYVAPAHTKVCVWENDNFTAIGGHPQVTPTALAEVATVADVPTGGTFELSNWPGVVFKKVGPLDSVTGKVEAVVVETSPEAESFGFKVGGNADTLGKEKVGVWASKEAAEEFYPQFTETVVETAPAVAIPETGTLAWEEALAAETAEVGQLHVGDVWGFKAGNGYGMKPGLYKVEALDGNLAKIVPVDGNAASEWGYLTKGMEAVPIPTAAPDALTVVEAALPKLDSQTFDDMLVMFGPSDGALWNVGDYVAFDQPLAEELGLIHESNGPGWYKVLTEAAPGKNGTMTKVGGDGNVLVFGLDSKGYKW